MNKDPSLHRGHFKRVRDEVLRSSEKLDQVKLLEIILQCVLQRGDTNELAKRILKLGDLASLTQNIMPEDLEKIEGIGKNTAEKLASLLRVLYLYLLSFGKETISIGPANYHNIINLLDSYFKGKDREFAVVFMLNQQDSIIWHKVINYGDENHVFIDSLDVLNTARRCGARKVVLAHNHPDGSLFPSIEDFNLTSDLYKFLLADGLELKDHIIHGKAGYFSFANALLMDAIIHRAEDPEYTLTWDGLPPPPEPTKKTHPMLN